MKTPDLVLAPVLSDRNTDYQLAWHEAAEEHAGGAPLSVLETREHAGGAPLSVLETREHAGGAPLSVLETRLEWMSDPTLARSTRQLVSRAELDGYRDYIRCERDAQYDDCLAEIHELEGMVLR
ncbi:hypothetical protein [Streptomyces mirabilis]|uniref:hypothetical protein n=1 Tax=Streptomyces mirabilis TaxID=68239 RepID=UPI0033C8800C